MTDTVSTGSAIVLMGVSGCGKTTHAKVLAGRISGFYIDADDLHSEAARTKMADGVALTDRDRLPWLREVGTAIGEAVREGKTVVAACSALKVEYRDLIRKSAGCPVSFVLLEVPAEEIKRRLQARTGHFMSPSLANSQFATLEQFLASEVGYLVDASGKFADVASRVWLVARRIQGSGAGETQSRQWC